MLTIAIIAKNEEKNINKALSSASFADETIVIDNKSTDNTVKAANKFSPKIFSNNSNSFSDLRNQALEESSNDWVFFLDADEFITDDLRESILKNIGASDFLSFRVKRRDFFMGKYLKHGEVQKEYNHGIVRLVKKNSGKFEGLVHESWCGKGTIGALQGFLDHNSHESIAEFLNKINYYSSIRAKEMSSKGERFNILKLLFFPFGKFIYTYFIKLGFLDGPQGFIYSFMMSFHSFLVRAKLASL